MAICRIDFHVHSCLSPCGALDMSPIDIAKTAREKGLKCVALCDHNSARNVPAFEKACRKFGIYPLFGIEACTREEVHLLCIFDTPEAALELGETLYSRLPPVKNDPERYGDQPVVTVDNEIIDFIAIHLGSAADIGLSELTAMVVPKGLAIPAHIDRSMFSIVSQLGMLTKDPFDAVEYSPHWGGTTNPDPSKRALPHVTGSDAHYLHQLGSVHTALDIDGPPTVASIREALRGMADV